MAKHGADFDMGSKGGDLSQRDTGQQQPACGHDQCGMHEPLVAQHRSIGERFGRVFGRDPDMIGTACPVVRSKSFMDLHKPSVRSRPRSSAALP